MSSEPSAEATAPAVRVLMVCYANHCRSPLMEQLLRSALARRPDLRWAVTSAGTHAQAGRPYHRHVVRCLGDVGVDVTGLRSARLSLEHVAAADLILTAGPDERRDVVALEHGAAPRTFPLLAFTHWLHGARDRLPAEPTAQDLIAALQHGRGQSQPLTVEEQTIEDPMGRSRRTFRSCTRIIGTAVDDLLGVVPRPSGRS